MLIPARLATAFVVLASNPVLAKICAPDSTIAFTVSLERSWRGIFLGALSGVGMSESIQCGWTQTAAAVRSKSEQER